MLLQHLSADASAFLQHLRATKFAESLFSDSIMRRDRKHVRPLHGLNQIYCCLLLILLRYNITVPTGVSVIVKYLEIGRSAGNRRASTRAVRRSRFEYSRGGGAGERVR